MEELFKRLATSFTDPVNIVLLLWIWWFIKDRADLLEINTKLLEAQEKRGITLTNISAMLDARLPAGRVEK